MKVFLSIKGQTDFSEMTNLAQKASNVGFAGLSLSEDLESCGPDAFVTIAALSKSCPDLAFMTNVVNQYSRHPLALATAVFSSIDLLDQKFVFGLGPGSPSTSIALNFESKRPLERLQEVLEILRGLAHNPREFHFAGKYFKIQGVSPVREKVYSLRIFIPGIQDKAVGFAATFGDGIMISNFSSLGYVRHVRDVIAKSRPLQGFGIACNVTYIPMNEVSEGLKVARPFAERFLSFPGIGESLLEHSGFDHNIALEVRRGSFDRVTNEVVESMAVVGNHDKLLERLRSLEKLGVEYVTLETEPFLQEKLVSDEIGI